MLIKITHEGRRYFSFMMEKLVSIDEKDDTVYIRLDDGTKIIIRMNLDESFATCLNRNMANFEVDDLSVLYRKTSWS